MALVATLFIHFVSQMRGVSVQTVVLLGIVLLMVGAILRVVDIRKEL